MDYIQIINEFHTESCVMEPATDNDISGLEVQLGRELPNELKVFIRQSNGAEFGGLVCIFGISNKYDQFIIIQEEWKNPEYEDMYPNSKGILFFAADGMGGYFGYTPENSIVHWDHEEDTVTEFGAQNLKTFIINCYKPLE